MSKGIAYRKKRYVSVIAKFDIEGFVVPLRINWGDGRQFKIDKILESRHGASSKGGSTGMRYLVDIAGHKTFLFYEQPAWFVEEKVFEAPRKGLARP